MDEGLDACGESIPEIYKLSDTVLLHRHEPFTPHGNVFKGVIKSGVYGDRECAIKFARRSEQNEREAKILSKLGYHTHVISLIQSGVDRSSLIDQVYLALEPCNKLNFRQYLLKYKEEAPTFDINWGFNYCKQIIAGMTHVHDNLIIHRDLKPSNILLSHDCSTVKIADFGSSVEIRAIKSTTYFDNGFGTLGYRPPEGMGKSFGSLKTDSYSLGMLFYFILSYGETPLGDDTAKWDINVKEGILDLSKLLVPNPKATKHLLHSMLAKERRCRPSIENIASHPCWSGEESDCKFEYEFEEEVLDDSTSCNEEENSLDSEDDECISETLAFVLRQTRIFGSKGKKQLKNKVAPTKTKRKSVQEDEVGHLETEIEKKRKAVRMQLIESLQESQKFEDVLIIAENELHLDRGRVDAAIERVQQSVYEPITHSHLDILIIATSHYRLGHFVRAMILFKLSHDMNKNISQDPNYKLTTIQTRVMNITFSIRPLINEGGSSRAIASKYGRKYIMELLNDLQTIRDYDADLRVQMEASCLTNMTGINNDLQIYEENIRLGEYGVSILEGQFGDLAVEYKNYGVLQNNLGVAYKNLGQISKAMDLYNKALEAYSHSLDFDTEEDRRIEIKNTRHNIENVRKLLSNK